MAILKKENPNIFPCSVKSNSTDGIQSTVNFINFS